MTGLECFFADMFNAALKFTFLCVVIAALNILPAWGFALAFLGWAAVFFSVGTTLAIVRRRRESR